MVNTTLSISPDGARAGEGRDMESPLDRSRAKANQAQEALAGAGRRVDDVDERLERNTAQTSADEKALAAARDEVKRLKKALKDAQNERQKLVLARKRAIAAVEKAEEKARKAEAKYDREVLADLIEREKEHDRSVPTASSTGPVDISGGQAQGAGADAGATRPAADDVPLTADGQPGAPAVEPEDLGTATARTTAARTTAASAGDAAQPVPEPSTPRRSTSRARTSRPASSSTANSSSSEGSSVGTGPAEATET